MKKLSAEFYLRSNVCQIAKELLGKVLVFHDSEYCKMGRIVEVEAYEAFTDQASHSYNGKRTPRNEHMYLRGGHSYVYICYGVHHLLNVVTGKKEVPDAVLIRGLEPITIDKHITKPIMEVSGKGPGKLTRYLGINKSHSGIPLTGSVLFIADDGFLPASQYIGISTRIGIEGSGPARDYPYRYYLKGNLNVSGSPNR